MSFTIRDLRRGMDVYDADNVYQGTVVWIVERDAPSPPAPRSRTRPSPFEPHWPLSRTRERGNRSEGLAFNGEALGPMPTAALGNTGPVSQTHATGYASLASSIADHAARAVRDREPAELVVLRTLTALDWSTLRPRLQRIPVSRVQSVSLERIVLTVELA